MIFKRYPNRKKLSAKIRSNDNFKDFLYRSFLLFSISIIICLFFCAYDSGIFEGTARENFNNLSDPEYNSVSYTMPEDAQEEPASINRTIIYFGDKNCEYCHEKLSLVETFLDSHNDVESQIYMLDLTDPDNIEWIKQQYAKYGIETLRVPVVVLIVNGSVTDILIDDQITTENLESWYTKNSVSVNSDQDLTITVSFISGIVIGASPCVLLVLSVFGSSILMGYGDKGGLKNVDESSDKISDNENGRVNYSNKKGDESKDLGSAAQRSPGKEKTPLFVAMKIMLGFISGLLSAYLVIVSIFLYALKYTSMLNYFKYIFGTIIMIIGIWQIIDMNNENSLIFKTPGKVKKFIGRGIRRNNPIWAFVIGFIFAFVKIPCFGGTFLSIIFAVRDNPQLWIFIWVYLIGMIIPVILTFMVLAWSANKINSKITPQSIDKFRIKFRPYLRLLSGLFIITLTLYILMEDSVFNIGLLMLILLIEIVALILLIIIKERREK